MDLELLEAPLHISELNSAIPILRLKNRIKSSHQALSLVFNLSEELENT